MFVGAAFVKIVSCLANSIFLSYTNADKTSIEDCISYIDSNYLCINLEMGSLSLKIEAIFLVLLQIIYNTNHGI